MTQPRLICENKGCGTAFPTLNAYARHAPKCAEATKGERRYYRRYRAWPSNRKGGYPDGH